jgi:MoaA/NifB/PqqE/SkfB family radical SAM enzyme
MKDSIQNIPVIFNDKFPAEFVNNVAGWGISEEELHSKLPDGTYKLLSLDLDFGLACSLKCPHCFQNNQNTYNQKKKLTWDETIHIIDQAADLGLKYVKILGAGEPFEEKNLLKLLVEFDKRNIHTAIFTKGHVLGSDELAKKKFGHEGITSSNDLVEKLYNLKTSILLGLNSFNNETQLDFVGITQKRNPLYSYPQLRDNALKLLVETGFNKYNPGVATRLAVVSAPFKPENIKEIFDIYRWGLMRNIYVATCPTTSSGHGNNELLRESTNDFDIYMNSVKDLYVRIYKWAIDNGAIKKDKFIKQGVSLYPGAHPCNQVACGLYIRLDGSVYLCPGNDNERFLVEDDLCKLPLKDVWMKSNNYNLAKEDKKFNFECIAREKSFFLNHSSFYQDVYSSILK